MNKIHAGQCGQTYFMYSISSSIPIYVVQFYNEALFVPQCMCGVSFLYLEFGS